MIKKISNIFIYLKYIIYYTFVSLLRPALRLLPKYRNLWLVCERKTDARDNGYHFFKYICAKHPEINSAYIIDRGSADYERVSELGKVIQPNTFGHMLALVSAEVCISTHVMGYAPDTYRFAVLDRYLRLVRGKRVFLQHGIIKADLKELYYPKAKLDIFCCTAEAEYNYLCRNYNHPAGVIQRTGLCRYDRLTEPHTVKRQILVMPTWRSFLKNLSDDEFRKSEYFRSLNGILESTKVHELLEKNDYEIVFYIHYELQKYTKLFFGDNPRVHILGFDNADVQELLMESAVLVTDYSSIYFDFAYMRKPMVYFWFDRKRFFGEHYKKGYFDSRTDGFGPVFTDGENVIRYLEKCVENGAKTDDVYLKRIDAFFGRVEYGSCERTYNAIRKLTEV